MFVIRTSCKQIMKPLYLNEDDVEKLVTVPEVIEVLETAFRDQASGRAWNESAKPAPCFRGHAAYDGGRDSRIFRI